MEKTKEAILATIAYLTEEFIVEECIGNMVDGCLSCEMIEARASLRKALEMGEFTDTGEEQRQRLLRELTGMGQMADIGRSD